MRKNNNFIFDLIQTVGLFGLVFFGFYFVFTSFDFSSKSDPDAVDIVALDRQVDRAINRSLKGINSQKQLRDLEMSADKAALNLEIKKNFKSWAPKQDLDSMDIINEDISSSEASMSSISIESQLRSKMDNDKDVSLQEKLDKKEYIRKFKENARKDGWLVELNDNLEVISAKEIN